MKQIIPGLEDVISTMQPGGERTCNIPSNLGFGAKGVCVKVRHQYFLSLANIMTNSYYDVLLQDECLVPPNENLKYAVKLLRVAPSFN